MTEEKLKQYIEGKRTQRTDSPFRVPDGYFDTLCDRVMQQLPEQPSAKPTKRFSLKHFWRYAAVIAVMVLVGASAYLIPNLKDRKDVQLANANISHEMEQSFDDEYWDDELDYAMVDNNEIALYLTEN